MSDFKFAFRTIMKRPATPIVATILLTLSIATVTVLFSALNALVLRPLKVNHPEQLVQYSILVIGNPRNPVRTFEANAYESVRDRSETLSAVFARSERTEFMDDDPTGNPITVDLVTGNYLAELGIRARLGRNLVADDDSETAEGTMPAVLSDSFWARRFDRSRDVIGKVLRIKGYPFQIVGVLPKEVNGIQVDSDPDVWIPSRARLRYSELEGQPEFEIYGRVRPGVPLERAQAEVFQLWDPFKKMPPAVQRRFRFSLEPVKNGTSRLRQSFSQSLILLVLAGVGLVVLVCFNVSGLLLARATTREKEIATRFAFGASRQRVARQLFIETVLIVGVSGLTGTALVYGLVPILARSVPPLWTITQVRFPIALYLNPDWRVFIFMLGISALAACLAGVLPALKASNTDLNTLIKGTEAVKKFRLGGILVSGQVALSTTLLIATALLVITFLNLRRLNPGFDAEHVVTLSIDLRAAGYVQEKAGVFAKQLLDRVRALPGVRSSAIAARGVMRGFGGAGSVARTGEPAPARVNVSRNDVTPRYFESMGISLEHGRDFEDADSVRSKPKPVVINQRFADMFFSTREPVGALFGLSQQIGASTSTNPLAGPDFQVVGVVANSAYRSMREFAPTFYVPERAFSPINLVVRTQGKPETITNSVRAVIQELDHALHISSAFSLSDEVEDSVWQERLLALLALAFGVLAMLVTSVGLYGLLSQRIAQRRREIAIRIAIGADSRNVIQAVSMPGAFLIGTGFLLGMGLWLAIGQPIEPLLYGTGPHSVLAFGLTLALLVLVGSIATLIPAARALHLESARVLRHDD